MMGFGTAVATCLRKFATFSGRAPRAEYWWFTLAMTLVGVPLEFVDVRLSLAFDVITLVPTFAVGWRRLHDVGKSGLWYVPVIVGVSLILVSEVNGNQIMLGLGAVTAFFFGIYLFILTVTRGDVGSNQYGEDPYDPRPDISVFD